MVAKGGPIGVIVPGEEVVVEGADAGEVEEGAVAAAEVGRLLAGEAAAAAALVVVVGVVPGEVEAGEEGFEGGVAVDVGGEEEGAVLDEGAEGEEEEGEEQEGDGVGVEGGRRVLQDLGGRPEVAQPRVVAHRRRFLEKRGNRRGLKSRKGPRDSWSDLDFSWRAGGRRRVFLGESDLWVMGRFHARVLEFGAS